MRDTDAGLASAVLVIVITWALAAVLMLSVTLVTAQQIGETVGELPDPAEGSVLNAVTDVDGNLGPVALATKVERTAGEVRTAVEPLSGQLDAVLAALDDIDASTRSIEGTATDLDATVRSIDATADDAGDTIAGLRGNLRDLRGVVGSVETTLLDASGKARTLLGVLRSIEADLAAAHHELVERGPTDDGIRGHAHSLECQLLGDGCERGVRGDGATALEELLGGGSR